MSTSNELIKLLIVIINVKSYFSIHFLKNLYKSLISLLLKYSSKLSNNIRLLELSIALPINTLYLSCFDKVFRSLFNTFVILNSSIMKLVFSSSISS